MADAVRNCAVGDYGKTDATDLFFKFNRQDRPAVVPPHAINGGSAENGGTFNSVGGGSRGSSPGGSQTTPTAEDGRSSSDEEEEEGGEEAYEDSDEDGAKDGKRTNTDSNLGPNLNPNPNPNPKQARSLLRTGPSTRGLISTAHGRRSAVPPLPLPTLPTPTPLPLPDPTPLPQGKADPYLSMMHALVQQGKRDDKAYEKREKARAKEERDHQLAMISLLLGKPATSP